LVDHFVDEGVVPKSEPIEEGFIGPPEYVYLIPDASSVGVVVAKTEQMIVSACAPDHDPIFGAGRMTSDGELCQMALDIIDTVVLHLIDEICEAVLNEDYAAGIRLLRGRSSFSNKDDFVSCQSTP
jgi:hypothetical protein